MDEVGGRCRVEAWRPRVAGIAEVFHAHIIDWGYPPHTHDTWTVLIVDAGGIEYSLDRRHREAAPSTVAVLPPGVVHDGQPASRAHHGFRKRCLYLEPDMLPADLIGPAVDKTVIVDPALHTELAGLHDALVDDTDPVDGEARLALVGERIRHHLRPGTAQERPEFGVAAGLRRLLDEHDTQPVTLAEAATVLDRSVAHLVRSFTAAFGVSPHAYLVGRRIEAARRLLLEGMAPARVATAAGFYDQAHLTRHFKRHTSTTPARYARRHR